VKHIFYVTMGTVEKIVDALVKMGSDKKTLAEVRYNEHSRWLNHEFSLIRDLIQQNPTDPASKTRQSSSSTRAASSSENSKAKSNSNKRKSPETAIGDFGSSPEMKRGFVDYAELATQAGLPADLNRLKKEQLLGEIESRGCTSMSLRALKKDLIDMLKSLLIVSESNAEGSEDQENASPSDTQDTSSSPDSAAIQENGKQVETQNKSDAIRNASMSDLRNQVQNSIFKSQSRQETDDERRTRLAAEFQARRNRHRDSAAARTSAASAAELKATASDQANDSGSEGKLEAQVATQVDGMLSESSNVDLNTSEDGAASTEDPNVAVQGVVDWKHDTASRAGSDDGSYESALESPTRNGNVNPTNSAQASVSPGESIEASPQHSEAGAEEEQKEESSDADADAAEGASPDSRVEIQHGAEPLQQQNVAVESTENPGEASAVCSDESTGNGSGSSSSYKAGENSSSRETDKGSGDLLVKKPTNLVSNTTSFLAGGKAVKQIASLKAAEKLKEAEEQRLRKKKEAKEAAIAKTTTSTSGAKNGQPSKAMESSSAQAATSTGNKTSAPSTSSSMSTVGKSPTNVTSPPDIPASLSKPKSKGLFGFIKNNLKATFSASKKGKESATESLSPAAKVGQPTRMADLGAKAPESVAATVSAPAPAPQTTANAPLASVAVTSTQQAVNIESVQTEKAPVVATSVIAKMASPESKSGVAASLAASKAPSAQKMKSVLHGKLAAATAAKNDSQNQYHSAYSPPTTPGAKKAAGFHNEADTAKPHPRSASKSPQEVEYPMDDRDSDSDSGSGTDDDKAAKAKKQKNIPEWARGNKLREMLEKQYGMNGHTAMDPDTIFTEINTCNLEEIFGQQEGKFGKYSKRTSSAHWDADQITLVERRDYRVQMGFSATPITPV
jgi:hypothetical protein